MMLTLLVVCIVLFEMQDKSDDKSFKSFIKFCKKRWYGKMLIGLSAITILSVAFLQSVSSPAVFFGTIIALGIIVIIGIAKLLIWLWD